MGFNFGSILSGIGNLFGGGGGQSAPSTNFFQQAGQSVPNFLNPQQLSYQNNMSSGGGGGFGGMLSNMFGGGGGGGGNNGGGGGGFGGISKLFGTHPVAGGLATMFGSQLIGNPKPPQLPQSFYDFQNQAQSGGPQISQTGANAVSGVLNQPFQQVSDTEVGAATHQLDLNYQEQLRQLNGMYKSLRPGTDPTSDTTYQRDLGNLNDQYARQKAEVSASVNRTALNDYRSSQLQGGQVAGQLGAENSNQQLAAVQTEVERLSAQWNLNAQQKIDLRNMLMSIGGGIAYQGGLKSLFPSYNPTVQSRVV